MKLIQILVHVLCKKIILPYLLRNRVSGIFTVTGNQDVIWLSLEINPDIPTNQEWQNMGELGPYIYRQIKCFALNS